MDTNAQFLRYTWLSAQLVQMVTRGSWLCDWCAREAITMHRKCFTVNTLRNFKRHRLLHRVLLQQKWYLFLYSSFKQLNTHKNSILHNCFVRMSDFHSLGKVLQGMWRRVQKKAKNRGPVHQHNTHQKALLATYGIDVVSDDPSIHSQHFCNSCYATTRRCEGCSVHRCPHFIEVYEWKNIGKGAL